MKPRLLIECVFWLSVAGVIYTYFLYPVLLFLCYALAQLRSDLRYLVARGDRRAGSLEPEELPGVSFLIPAYNEQQHLANKLANLGQIDYPRHKLQVVFVSDGSTDRTNEILQGVTDPNIEMVVLPKRSGKPIALNHAAARARHEILVFSDVSTLFAPDVVRNLVRHFSDSRVGAVCGAVQLVGNAESQQTEGVYWKYESMLHLMEARLGATVTASGAIYALRRSCYQPLEPGDVIDDFLVPMHARRLGYQVLHDPEAIATEFSADSVQGEFTRRVRLAVGSFRALPRIAGLPLWNFAGIALVSHKLLRWILPFLLIGLLVSNCLLWRGSFYRVALVFQLAFYLWAGLGFLLRKRMQKMRYALVGYFLVAIHLAFLVGFWRYLWGQGDSTWQRVN
jgi:cellulose synthase/poly-beta-1,6-N-acetylglucosamine synthase-like glycosyltransferase